MGVSSGCCDEDDDECDDGEDEDECTCTCVGDAAAERYDALLDAEEDDRLLTLFMLALLALVLVL